MVTAHPGRSLSAGEICSALGVADRTLRSRCHAHLGMGPSRYWRLYRMRLARRALQSGDPKMAGVSRVAGRYGFIDPSRFAASYRALFNETPSATLQRSLGG
ncbi:MAG: helix-turn-helix transcriptional regulator [Acetobacteraceae bacterium]